MKPLHIASICVAMLLTGAPVLEAQTIPREQREYGSTRSPDEFTDEEIQKFSEVMKAVETVQSKAQAEIDEILAKRGMSMDAYNQLAERVKNSSPDNRPSEEELERFALINQKLMDTQQRIQPELMRIVEESGIHPRDYEDKLKAYRDDEAFRKKVQARM